MLQVEVALQVVNGEIAYPRPRFYYCPGKQVFVLQTRPRGGLPLVSHVCDLVIKRSGKNCLQSVAYSGIRLCIS
jgi:hypothetical protein